MNCVPQPDPDVVTTAMPDGEMILLHLRTRQYFSLNVTGTLVWELMMKSATIHAMGRALFDLFEVTPEAAEVTVNELLDELKSHRLIRISAREALTR